MEKQIRKATELITDSDLGQDLEVSELTKCAVEIGTIAFTTLKDELREKALNIAKAIAEYEDEINRLTHS